MGFFSSLFDGGKANNGNSDRRLTFTLAGATFRVVDVDFNYDARGSKYQNFSPPYAYFCCFSPDVLAPAIIYELDATTLRLISKQGEDILGSFKNFIKPHKDQIRTAVATKEFTWNGKSMLGVGCYNFIRLPLHM